MGLTYALLLLGLGAVMVRCTPSSAILVWGTRLKDEMHTDNYRIIQQFIDSASQVAFRADGMSDNAVWKSL